MDQPGANRPGFHALRETELRTEFSRYGSGERNQPVGASLDVEAVKPASVGDDDLLSAGKEGIAGKHVAARIGAFLVVMLHWKFQPSIVQRGQIADAQAGLRVVASPIDQLCAVGRQLRTKRAALGGGEHVFFAGAQITPGDLPGRKLLRGPGAQSTRIVNVVRTGRHGDAERVVPFALGSLGRRFTLDDLHAGAAVQIVLPQSNDPP